jgi:hypothetical protein
MYTNHDLIADLTKELNLTPEQQFLVAARVKRHVHSEKFSIYCRIFHYSSLGKFRSSKSRRIKNKAKLEAARWIGEFAEIKMKTHFDMAKMADKEIVTWSVGSHVYEQNPKPEEKPKDGDLSSI